MVVPLSLDPGHNDPRSPLYIPSDREKRERRRREEEAAAEAARAEELRRRYRLRQEANAVAGGPPTDYELRRREPRPE